MLNYFNYFTEIENFYQTKRKSFTLLTTLDWALVENWKDQGIPLELVLKGIDRAFSRAKRDVTHLAYCVKAVAEVCNEQKELTVEAPLPPDFAAHEVAQYLNEIADGVVALKQRFPEFTAKFDAIADSVRNVEISNLREAEQSLGALEEKLVSLLKAGADDVAMLEVKRDVDRELNPFRSTMSAEQLTMLEHQLWRRLLLERFNAPRLSLFYLI